jgi:KTSC domain
MMQYQPVASSNITHVGYDSENGTLGVRFSSGKEYHYDGVRPEQHAALVGAPSVGSHFAAHIRPAYTGKPV